MPFIEVRNASLSYASRGSARERVDVLDNLSLSVDKDEFVCIFGPNGCGKTSILNIIAGLATPDSGTIAIDGKPPGKTRTSFIFQNFQDTLLPWLTCLGNLTFPLELRGVSKAAARRKAIEYLEGVRSELPIDRYPYQLSGGQKQLLAIHRALLFQPGLFLLDEPFNSLDYDMRTTMEDQLLAILVDRRVATLFVSHEVDEAIYLSDRVIVLSRRPAKVVADIRVELKRPRDQSVVRTDGFSKIKRDVLTAFGEGCRQ